jgi:hypothetical protein
MLGVGQIRQRGEGPDDDETISLAQCGSTRPTVGCPCHDPGVRWCRVDDRRERMVVVAADTRISVPDGPLTDAGVKTYELGGPCAMVAAGHALPPMMAAELTRSLIENHIRRSPDSRVTFFDTVRLASFFLKRAAEEQSASSQAAVAGFLKAGAPCVASIVVSPGFNRAAFHKIEAGGTTAPGW